MPRKYESMQERIIANSVHSAVNAYADTYCWEWIGKVKRNRVGTLYPVVSVRYPKSHPKAGKVHAKLAHRASIEAFHGIRMPKSRVAKHLCNNTLCVNPAHLQGGTQKSNVRQAVREGRHNGNSPYGVKPRVVIGAECPVELRSVDGHAMWVRAS